MKYKVIYADPPWSYKDKCHSGKRGVDYKYSTMSIDDIKNLPVKDIAEDDSVLFLWCTFPLIKEGIDCLEAWGFTYKTIAFNWVKVYEKSGKLFWGMGNWTRSNSEICLLGVRGKPKRIAKNVHSVILSPVEHHSKKPDEIRKRIVDLMGNVSRIELFAREKSEGWVCLGNGINGKDIKEELINENI